MACARRLCSDPTHQNPSSKVADAVAFHLHCRILLIGLLLTGAVALAAAKQAELAALATFWLKQGQQAATSGAALRQLVGFTSQWLL